MWDEDDDDRFYGKRPPWTKLDWALAIGVAGMAGYVTISICVSIAGAMQ